MSEIIKPSEDPRFFSLNRAKRGAKIGAYTGAGLATSLIALTAVSAGISNPELFTQNFGDFLKIAGVLEVGATVPLSTAGALIDGIRPTSRLAERKINNELETLRSIKNAATKTWRFVRQPKVLDRIAQTENKGEIATKVVLVGGLASASVVGYKALKDTYKPALEGVFNQAVENPANLPDYLSDHSVELALGVGAIATLVGVKTFLNERRRKRLQNKTDNIEQGEEIKKTD